ncbi:siderophore-interacting protein [Paracoccus marinaquae]|uniref:Siderophore-interacting protein n=1 Tax=Paracoccus marinaquae TaxID=2841926 RepID=A0ABS6AKG6_9RHOB|nr:siderophore-interacting protein [Paracoccus marinaquae]MBU3030397.1 siderophore-interacting protein [Paracoccus marinaquae]
MRHDTPPPLQSEAALPGLPFAQIDALLRAEAEAHGLVLRSGHGRSTWCEVDRGEFGARMGPEGSILYVRASDRDWLFTLQETVSSHVAEAFPGQAGLLRWSGLDRAGEAPPNFSLARVESIRPVGDHFLRLRLRGEGLERLARAMIHFRLILPQPGDADPQWPVIGPNGQTVWPKGDKELHRPAYTVRAIDPAAGWMETDVFIHDGGRICGWLASAAPGSLIGLTGPGGGGVPVAPRLLIGGDETAYPALARIIEAQPRDSRGECWLFGTAGDYPLPEHPGISLILAPGDEARLANRLARDGTTADSIWIATEKSRLAPLRRVILDELAIPKQATHLAAYWTAAKVPA